MHILSDCEERYILSFDTTTHMCVKKKGGGSVQCRDNLEEDTHGAGTNHMRPTFKQYHKESWLYGIPACTDTKAHTQHTIVMINLLVQSVGHSLGRRLIGCFDMLVP